MRYVTAESAKERAPLDALLAYLGYPVGDDDKSLCPFHDDSEPSLWLWMGDDGQERWHCFVCGIGGDQIDLLRRIRGLTFGQAVVELDEIADSFTGAIRRVYRKRDPDSDARALHETVSEAMERAKDDAMQGYMSLYATRLVDPLRPEERFDYDAMLRGLGWGVDDLGRVVMPHWDAAGELTGAKLRAPDGTKSAVPGSRFTQLYLSWIRPTTKRAVILCEGETDSAYALRHMQTQACAYSDVRGTSGAGHKPTDEDLDQLAVWDTVYTAFDGDAAGAEATARYAEALRDRCEVRALPVPGGEDLRSTDITVNALVAMATLV